MEDEFRLEETTHAIVIMDPASEDDAGSIEMVHFVGFKEEPDEQDLLAITQEIETNEEFGLSDIADRLEYYIVDGDKLKDILKLLEE